jgi:hypothetical protein
MSYLYLFKSKVFLSIFITLLFLCLNYFVSVFANHYLPVADVVTREFGQSRSFSDYFVATNIREIWLRWDSNFYEEIIRDGYDKGPFTTEIYKNWAFYPLYPILVKIIATLLMIPLNSPSIFYIGIVLSNIFIAVTVYFLLKTMEIFEMEQENKLIFLFLLFLSPGGYFFHMFYTESLFAMTSVLTFYFLFNRNYFLAAVFLALALITRVIAIAIIPAFVIYYFISEYNRKGFIDMIAETIAYGVLALLPLFAFFIYLYYLTGNFFAAFQIQTAWGNTGLLPFGIFARYYDFHGFFVFWDYFFSVATVLLLILYGLWLAERFYFKAKHLAKRKEVIAILIYIMGYIAILSAIQNFNSVFRYISANVFIFLIPFLILKFDKSTKNTIIIHTLLAICAFLHVLFLIFFVNNIPAYGF